MTQEMTRRHWLKLLAAGATVSGCDRVNILVTDKADGLLSESGIDPISTTEQFYVYQYSAQPDVDFDAWQMEIMVRGETVLTIDEAWLWEQEDTLELEHTLQCIGGNPRNTLISNAVWGGLPFIEVISRLGLDLDESHIQIRFEGADNYKTSIPISDYYEEKLWLMWKMNGEPLNYDHGRPCRFICQGRYGTKNLKWPTEVDFIDVPFSGFWESTGWSESAVYRANGFILQPFEGAIVNSSTVDFYGTAHAGEDPIARVEISFDEGASWEDAEIYYGGNGAQNIWTLWTYRLEGAVGEVVAQVRVTTDSGAMSQEPEGTDQAEGYDGGMRIRFQVESA